jgi:hypothetical protein
MATMVPRTRRSGMLYVLYIACLVWSLNQTKLINNFGGNFQGNLKLWQLDGPVYNRCTFKMEWGFSKYLSFTCSLNIYLTIIITRKIWGCRTWCNKLSLGFVDRASLYISLIGPTRCSVFFQFIRLIAAYSTYLPIIRMYCIYNSLYILCVLCQLAAGRFGVELVLHVSCTYFLVIRRYCTYKNWHTSCAYYFAGCWQGWSGTGCTPTLAAASRHNTHKDIQIVVYTVNKCTKHVDAINRNKLKVNRASCSSYCTEIIFTYLGLKLFSYYTNNAVCY